MQNLVDKIARYQEIERRGLLEKLPIEKQQAWAEVKRRGLDKKILSGEQIGTSQPTEPVQAPYSAMDKVKYTLRAAGEAAPFGMGDLVAGYVGAQARNLADYTHGKDLKTRVKGLGKLAFGIISPKDFKEERADFIREQEEFAKHHGGLNFAGEMVGGLLTGGAGAARNVIGKQGLKALVNAGAREGAKFGVAYGAGSGFTQDTDKLSVYDALKGAAIGGAGGALTGAALPLAFGGAIATGRGIGKFLGTKKAAQRGASEIFDAAGGTGIDAVVASDEGTTALREGIKSDKKIAKKIKKIANEKIINSVNETKDIIRKTLGAEDIEEAKAKAAKHYEEVIASDPIYVPDNIYNNKGLKNAVKNAIKNDYNDELEKKGINSLYGVQAVKEELDDKIAKSMVIGKTGVAEPTKATTRLQKVKAKFLENVDAVAPQYKQARAEYEEAIAPYDLLAGLLKNQGRDRSDTINSILTHKNEAAIRKVFGNKKAEELLTALRTQAEQNKHFNTLYSDASTELIKPSPSSNKNLARETLESRGSVGGTILDIISLGGRKRLRRNIAEILLSGKNPSGRAITPKAMPEQSGQSISGYLGGKLKEKGGYAMKTLGQSGLDGDGLKAKQLEIIKKTNPMHDDYHVGIIEIKDIKTFAEAVNDPESFVYPDFSKDQAQKALKDGKITIYSSKPIKNGGFVSTSKRMAQDYAGSGKVYSKEVPLDNVAWISGDEGQYAKIKAPKVSEVLNSLGEPVAKTAEGIKNFNKWFKGSKVVDEQGKPLVVYHGTADDFSVFDKSKTQTPMFWFTADKASLKDGRTSTNAKGGVKKIMEVYLDIKNPANSDQYENFTIDQLKARGFDGVKLGKKDGYSSDVYIAFEPTQIKSVKNSGKFDPKNPNIYKSLIGGLGISQILKSKENK